MGKNHIVWIDVAKTLTMLLVIVGHCTYTEIATDYGGVSYFSAIPYGEWSFVERMLNLGVTVIYAFHMPLFMMLSGICFRLTAHKVESMKALMKKKAERLVIPFFWTTLLVSVPLKLLSGYYVNSTNVIRDIVLGQFLLMGNSHLWFIVSLFWIFLVFYWMRIHRIADRKWSLPVLLVLSLAATYVYAHGYEFMGIVLALKHLFYFALGFRCFDKLSSVNWGGGSSY